MKARINDLLEIEGTPAEMYDYFLLHFRVIRHRRPMSEATKERIRQAMRKRWTTLKRQKV